jgi:phosphoglycerate dehydrogenase-like enzyme
MPDLPEKINVLVLPKLDDAEIERIRAVAPDRLKVTPAWADFFEELEQDWPDKMLARHKRDGQPQPRFTPEEREALLQEAHVILIALPFLKNLYPRTRNLRWIHFSFAGVSDLRETSYWRMPVTVTSARGYALALPIAETVMAGALMFAKRLDEAARITMQGNVQPFGVAPRPKLRVLDGVTMGIIGLGGIGRHVAHLSKAFGMRVVATRRSAQRRATDVEGVDELFPPSELHTMLEQCDVVALCTMLTEETWGILNAEAFASMKDGAYVINIARGELIDVPALVQALRSGKLGGAYLDVWDDDFNQPPDPELAVLPNVVLTPHRSGLADWGYHYGVKLFRENLRRFLDGESLENVMDWDRGY